MLAPATAPAHADAAFLGWVKSFTPARDANLFGAEVRDRSRQRFEADAERVHEACCWNSEISSRRGLFNGDQCLDASETLQQRQSLRPLLQRHRRAALRQHRN